MKQFFNSKGFTLVELLVVIAVLGILAAGLLATIDPLEQLRKGADTNTKTAALEFINATTRYYGTNGQMPWGTSSISSSGLNLETGYIESLVADGELKATFKDQTAILKKIFVTGDTTSVVACFDPESKSESKRPETKYDKSGVTLGSTGGTTGYWCAR